MSERKKTNNSRMSARLNLVRIYLNKKEVEEPKRDPTTTLYAIFRCVPSISSSSEKIHMNSFISEITPQQRKDLWLRGRDFAKNRQRSAERANTIHCASVS